MNGPIYFRAIAVFVDGQNNYRVHTGIFRVGADIQEAFSDAYYFLANGGNQVPDVKFVLELGAIQEWQNGVNQGIIHGNKNLSNV